jgi:ferredoxin
MRVYIDSRRCQGHGLCYAEAPEMFTDDDVGHGVVTATGELDSAGLAKAQAVARMCPEIAISVEATEPEKTDS